MKTLENLQDEVQIKVLIIRPDEYQVLAEQTDGTIAQIDNFIWHHGDKELIIVCAEVESADPKDLPQDVREKCGRRYCCRVVDRDFNEKRSGTRHCTKRRGHKGRCGKA